MDLSTMTTPSCPTCGAALPATASPKKDEAARFLPFCSARCKQADLGAWASESYRIEAGPLADFEDSENDSEE